MLPRPKLGYMATSAGQGKSANKSKISQSKNSKRSANQNSPESPTSIANHRTIRTSSHVNASNSISNSSSSSSRSHVRRIPIAQEAHKTANSSVKLSTTILTTIISTLSPNMPKSSQPALSGQRSSDSATSPIESNSTPQSVHNELEYEDSILSDRLNDYYRPEVGIRTGLILASMLLLIVVYLLWRNRCRCIRGSHGSLKNKQKFIITFYTFFNPHFFVAFYQFL